MRSALEKVAQQEIRPPIAATFVARLVNLKKRSEVSSESEGQRSFCGDLRRAASRRSKREKCAEKHLKRRLKAVGFEPPVPVYQNTAFPVLLDWST